MAKLERKLRGNFDELLSLLQREIMDKNVSASLEDTTDYECDNFRCAVRVFERYSIAGSNRVSLNITLIGKDDELFISAITSGGSQAIFFKINTWGENSFLDVLCNIIDDYIDKNQP